MLTRRHIRVKVMQALYIYYNDQEKSENIPLPTKQMERNISRIYELYLYLLNFLGELSTFSKNYEEEMSVRYVKNSDSVKTRKLFEAETFRTIEEDAEFQEALKVHKIIFNGEGDLLRKIFFDLKNQEIYSEYTKSGETDRLTEQELIIFILKHYTSGFALFQQHMEEEFPNWLDDRKYVLQLIIKSIQQIGDPEKNWLFIIDKNDAEILDFARELLEKTVKNDSQIAEIIKKKVSRWETYQVSLVDMIILKMAVSEFLFFPSIPVKVTINEYIELAKSYSTPQSKNFVNGVLDAILQDLKKEKKMIKN